MNPKIQFTKEEVELAAKVSNDIAEDIDCRETRAQLRRCIAYWSWQFTMLATVHSNMVVKQQVDAFENYTHQMTKTLEERYCGLTDKSKCSRGFPGCAWADDLMCGEEEGYRNLISQLTAAKSALVKAREALNAQKDTMHSMGFDCLPVETALTSINEVLNDQSPATAGPLPAPNKGQSNHK